MLIHMNNSMNCLLSPAPPNRPTIMDAKTRSHTRLLEPYNEGDSLELICECFGGKFFYYINQFLKNTYDD